MFKKYFVTMACFHQMGATPLGLFLETVKILIDRQYRSEWVVDQSWIKEEEEVF